MFALILTVSVVLQSKAPCRASLLDHRSSGRTCYEYATAKSAPDHELVVYALEDVDPEEQDFRHRVFVALIRSASGRVVERSDVTKYMLDMGEHDGTFASMRAEVALFRCEGAGFARVVLWSTLSGSGGITSSSEVLFESTDVRTPALVLRDTAGAARGGWSYRSETSSDFFVLNGDLMWVRRSKVAKAKKANEPFVVHCKVSRRVYHRVGRHFERTSGNEARLSAPGMTLIGHDEVAGESSLPCCQGCTFGMATARNVPESSCSADAFSSS